MKKGGQGQIGNELKDVQRYVNGMTDGWFDFVTADSFTDMSEIL